jgi:hypothetical protein
MLPARRSLVEQSVETSLRTVVVEGLGAPGASQVRPVCHGTL